MTKTNSKVSRFKYKLKLKLIGSKESVKNKLRVSKKRIRSVLSTRNCTLFAEGFLIGVVGISLIHMLIELFRARPALAEDLPNQNLANVERIKPNKSLWIYLSFPILCGVVSGLIVFVYIRGFEEKRYTNLLKEYKILIPR